MQILTEFCASDASHFIGTLHDRLQGAKAVLLRFFFLNFSLCLPLLYGGQVQLTSKVCRLQDLENAEYIYSLSTQCGIFKFLACVCMDVALHGFVFHSRELLREPNVSLDPSFGQLLLETANYAALLQFRAFIYDDLHPASSCR